ncbi:MAG: hypothetical protein JNL73_11815 [Anaerolineales bacterium]|nr:hypothetical protein [Anaerolineales bacterium]
MPAGRLRVLPESLEAQSTRLRRLRGDELQSAIADLRTLSQRLDAAWSGEARAAFGDGFSSWLTRVERRGHDLERLAGFLSATAAECRALEADLVDGASVVPERPHNNDATRAQTSAGGAGGLVGTAGPLFGLGGGINARAGGTFSPIALTGNPLEDLWNWLMSLFGAAPQPQSTPTPTAMSPLTVGVTPGSTPDPYPWAPTDSGGASPVVCTADPSTTPANLQPYLINAACTDLVGQLEPDQAALLIQQVNSGQTILTPLYVNGFWVLQATDTLTGKTSILATAQDEDGSAVGNDGGAASPGGGGSGPTGAQDPAEAARLIQKVQDNGAKISPERVTWIRELDDGRIVWLEQGNDRSGLEHIVASHGDQFQTKGVPPADIPAILADAIESEPVLVFDSGEAIYSVSYGGNRFHVLIAVGDNGYIVTAHPISLP